MFRLDLVENKERGFPIVLFFCLPLFLDSLAPPSSPRFRPADLARLLRERVREAASGFECLLCGRVIKRQGHMRRHLLELHVQQGGCCSALS